MADEKTDVLILGGGPGGYLAAERIGSTGKKVVLVEKQHLGGVCLNSGCIPTKSLLHSAKLYHAASGSERYGVTFKGVVFDLTKAMSWKEQVVTTQVKGIEYLMKHNGVTVVDGEGRLQDRQTIIVNGDQYSAASIILATGSSAIRLPIPGSDLPHVVTNTEILNLTELPKKLVIIGGGVIGLEFASFFSMVGVSVTVIEMLPEIVANLDADITGVLRKSLPEVTFCLDSRVVSIDDESVTFFQGGKEERVEADLVLMAVGRSPNINGLGLESNGIDFDRKGIRVNEKMQTNIPGVYAVGDVTGRSLLAHSAYRMAEVAANTLSDTNDVMRYHAVPWVVYTDPEVAGVGLTEQQAKEEKRSVTVAKTPMRINGRFLAEHGKKDGFCKVIVDKESQVLLGVQMVGGICSEIIYGAGAMIEAELRVRDIKEILFPHPTVSELIRDTLWTIK